MAPLSQDGESVSPKAALGSPGRIVRLARKELKETLRDRRTILTLVLMPVLVYPLLSVLFQRFLLSSALPSASATYHFGVATRQEARAISELLSLGDRLLSEGPEQTPNDPDTLLPGSSADDVRVTVEYLFPPDLPAAVARRDVDLGIRLDGLDEQGNAPPPEQLRVELILQRSSRIAAEAAQYVEMRLLAARNKILERRLARDGASKSSSLWTLSSREVAPVDGAASFSLSSLVPLILVLMTITGAVYPSIDLTAGERERGTLEALIAAPVPRLGLLLAKYIAVLTVAIMTAAVNLTAMTVTIMAVGLGPVLFGKAGLPAWLVFEVFALLCLFASFFSAVLLAITSFARSFKEAQAYLIPVMMVSMAPGMAALLPGMALDRALAVTPLLNVVLLARDLCEQQTAPLELATAVVVSTLLYAGGALAIAARVFGADAILYGGQGSWSDLFRRPERTQNFPTLGNALLCLATLFPIYLLSSQVLGRSAEMDISFRLFLSAALTMGLFSGIPVVACLMRRVRLSTAFQLRGARFISFLAAALFGLSLWAIDFEVVAAGREMGVGSLTPDMQKHVKAMIEQWRTLSPVWIILALAVTPAVCEELFFRGYLLTALRTRLPAPAAILVSAVMFGAFHLILSGGVSVIRFIPSTLMGLVLGWSCVRSQSVFPGILLHAIHNGLLLSVAYYGAELRARGWDVEDATHLPPLWLGIAVMASAAGVFLMSRQPRPSHLPTAEPNVA